MSGASITFTAKGYLYGPVLSGNLIRQSTANTYLPVTTGFAIDPILAVPNVNEKVVSFSNTGGFGSYKTGELVYEGRTVGGANATGYVKAWDPQANALFVTDINGILKSGRTLFGAVSNAAYVMNTFSLTDLQLTKLVVKPSPNTANANTAFGYDEIHLEFPNIV